MFNFSDLKGNSASSVFCYSLNFTYSKILSSVVTRLNSKQAQHWLTSLNLTRTDAFDVAWS